LSVDLDFNGLAVINISQADVNLFSLWLNTSFSLLLTTSWATSATHEHAEDVIHAATAAGTSLETFHAVFIIDFSLILVE
jgi:hypothetical protein